MTEQHPLAQPLRDALERTMANMASSGTPVPTLTIDGPLPFRKISRAMVLEMNLLQPFGEENPEPLFVADDVRVISSKTLSGGHRRMTLQQGEGPGYQAIHFNPPPHTANLDYFHRVAFRLQMNRWNGRESIQLMIEDVAH